MLLEPGYAQHWPPGTVSALQVRNPSGADARLTFDGEPVAVSPHEQADLRVAGEHEAALANIGDVPVELSWATGYDAVEEHPEYASARDRGRLVDDQRQEIIEAWNKSFDPESRYYLPAQFAQFDPMTLADRSGIDLKRGFSTFCPGYDRGSAWADGNARGDLRSMVARGLSGITNGGDPTFADSDRSVTYRVGMASYDLEGTLYVTQSCCSGMFGWCWDTDDYRRWNRFRMTLKDVVLAFDAVVVEPTDDQPLRVSVTATRVEKRGGVDLSFPSDTWLPDWLQWLLTDWQSNMVFKDATEVAVTTHLEQGAIRTALETVLNAELQAAPVAA